METFVFFFNKLNLTYSHFFIFVYIQPPDSRILKMPLLVTTKTNTRHPIRRLVETVSVQPGSRVVFAPQFSERSLCFRIQPCPERQRRRQERMVSQQAKAEQLKRLHRAQVWLSPVFWDSLVINGMVLSFTRKETCHGYSILDFS